MELDVHLGKWYPVERNLWYKCYKSKSELFWRNEEEKSFWVMTPIEVTIRIQPCDPHKIQTDGIEHLVP